MDADPRVRTPESEVMAGRYPPHLRSMPVRDGPGSARPGPTRGPGPPGCSPRTRQGSNMPPHERPGGPMSMFKGDVVYGGGPPPPGAAVGPRERLSGGRTAGLGAQHVVAMFGATFVFPL